MWSVGIVGPTEIDEINILEATKKACVLAVNSLVKEPSVVVVDGNMKFHDRRFVSYIEGDDKSTSIAAASIIAKATRDRMMDLLHEEFPHENWVKNSGYGTREHILYSKNMLSSAIARIFYLLNDPVACSVFRAQIAELPFVPWTTDPLTLAELPSQCIISCSKKAFLLNIKPRKDSVMEHHHRTIVLGAPHQLRCAALSLVVILSNTSSRLRASIRNDRKHWRLQVQHQIQLDAAVGFSKGVFRGIARLVKQPMVPTPKLQLEDGSRIIDEHQATERWLRVASERHDGQPTSATALLETIVQVQSMFAATVRQEWVCPSLK